MISYELDARYDSRASFYSKARVEQEGNIKRLRSYNTIVAEIDTERETAKVFGTFSDTTLRHIKEFLKQDDFIAETKAQIIKDYMD